MIYFLTVLQLLFLLITVSSKQCPERSVTRVHYQFSENGNYYGTIKTPNFPSPFSTPYNHSFVIDASELSNDTQINVYLTQMYLYRGVRFFQLPSYNFCDHKRKQWSRIECRNPKDQAHSEMIIHNMQDTHGVTTSCPFLEIQVNVPQLYGYHYRTRDPFLFDVYGFNITFEIVPQRLGPKENVCSLRNCSNLGHCYIDKNWRDFFCDCSRNHPGRYCQFSPQCNPEKNVTFCENGGQCRHFGSGQGYCTCPPGFFGAWCEQRNDQPKVSAQTGCSTDTSTRPCHCRPNSKSGLKIPEDWVKYEAIISISTNYTILPNQSTVGYELQKNITRWFQSNNLTDLHNVLVNFEPAPQGDSHPQPQILLVHFHGPSGLMNRTEQLLNQYLFGGRNPVGFRRLIPLVKNSLKLYAMPRIQYKSIEFSKPRLQIGKSVIITCTAFTGTSKYYSTRDIRFRWFKDGLPVNLSIATRHMNYFQTHTNGNETMSHIVIDLVSAYDRGRYDCEVTDIEFGDQVCGNKTVDVVLLPQIEITPMTVTLEKSEKRKVITCTDGSNTVYDPNNKSTDFQWFRGSKDLIRNDGDGMVVVEDIFPKGQGLLLRIKAEQSDSLLFTCTGTNQDGGVRSKVIRVEILDSKNSPSCKEHYEHWPKQTKVSEVKNNILAWEWTAAGSVAMLPCPDGFIGYVQRPCLQSSPVEWGTSDFSRCISKRLKDINGTLQHAKRGFGDWQDSNGIKLMNQLEGYLNVSQGIYPGEGEKIIAIMDDILAYVLKKGKIGDTVLQVFRRTAIKLLSASKSCVQQKSIFTLCKTIEEMNIRGAMHASKSETDKLSLIKPYIVPTEVFTVQTLPISATAKYRDVSYVFPQMDAIRNSTPSWLKDNILVYFPLDSMNLQLEANSPPTCYLTIAAYKNLTDILVPSENSIKRIKGPGKRSLRTSVELVSPIVQISIPKGYRVPPKSHIKIHFNLSKERSVVSRSVLPSNVGVLPSEKGTFYVCGELDNRGLTKTEYGSWTPNVCPFDVLQSSYVECQCKRSGLFGLLRVTNLEDEILEENKDIPRIIILGFSFCMLSCVVSAAVQCVYLRCRFSLNSLYTLKLLDCFFIFAAVFIVLLGRTEMPSSSWLVWSTSACSFLISSLCVQLVKGLRILLMEATINLPSYIFPWLRSVSPVSLLSAIIFSTVLPVWTATVAKLIGGNSSNESAFQEQSVVFFVFAITVGLVVLAFLALYYRAVLKTKGEMERFREQKDSSANNSYLPEILWILTYRMKTLNRSLCLSLILLNMTLGIVLYENLRHSLFIQYFLGLSAATMGIALVLSYIFQSEFPIHISLCKPEKLIRKDPEKDAFLETKGSQRKLYAANNSDLTGNGSIVGTTVRIPAPASILRNSNRQLGDESETLSVSTVEEQSMDTFSTEMSFRTSVPPPPGHKPPCSFNKRNNRSVRSTGSKSSNGSSYRGSRKLHSDGTLLQPIRGRCFISSGDYIMPSVRNTSLTTDRPTVQSESSATSSSSYNYVPINDQDDIQKKISHDLSILLPMHDK